MVFLDPSVKGSLKVGVLWKEHGYWMPYPAIDELYDLKNLILLLCGSAFLIGK